MEQSAFEKYLVANGIKHIGITRFQSPTGVEVTLEQLLGSHSFKGFIDGFNGKPLQIIPDPKESLIILPKSGRIKYTLEAREVLLPRFEYIREYALGKSARH